MNNIFIIKKQSQHIATHWNYHRRITSSNFYVPSTGSIDRERKREEKKDRSAVLRLRFCLPNSLPGWEASARMITNGLIIIQTRPTESRVFAPECWPRLCKHTSRKIFAQDNAGPSLSGGLVPPPSLSPPPPISRFDLVFWPQVRLRQRSRTRPSRTKRRGMNLSLSLSKGEKRVKKRKGKGEIDSTCIN